MTSSLTHSAETDPDFRYWSIGARWDAAAHKSEGRQVGRRPKRHTTDKAGSPDPSPEAWEPVPIVTEHDEDG